MRRKWTGREPLQRENGKKVKNGQNMYPSATSHLPWSQCLLVLNLFFQLISLKFLDNSKWRQATAPWPTTQIHAKCENSFNTEKHFFSTHNAIWRVFFVLFLLLFLEELGLQILKLNDWIPKSCSDECWGVDPMTSMTLYRTALKSIPEERKHIDQLGCEHLTCIPRFTMAGNVGSCFRIMWFHSGANTPIGCFSRFPFPTCFVLDPPLFLFSLGGTQEKTYSKRTDTKQRRGVFGVTWPRVGIPNPLPTHQQNCRKVNFHNVASSSRANKQTVTMRIHLWIRMFSCVDAQFETMQSSKQTRRQKDFEQGRHHCTRKQSVGWPFCKSTALISCWEMTHLFFWPLRPSFPVVELSGMTAEKVRTVVRFYFRWQQLVIIPLFIIRSEDNCRSLPQVTTCRFFPWNELSRFLRIDMDCDVHSSVCRYLIH